MKIYKICYSLLVCILAIACSPQPAGNSVRNSKREKENAVATQRTKTKTPKKTTASSQKYSAQKIYKMCNPAVFTVTTANDIYTAQGSGFFISPDGLAVSNYHVFKGSYKGAEVIYMASGEQYKVKEVIQYSNDEDFILFQVDVGSKIVPYIKVTNRKPVIGNKIYAIGSPKGFTNTLSSGEISQLRGDYFIQINAPIDHGSSGGALINEYGEVIGITSGGVDDSGANLNYAIDISVVKPYIPKRR